MILLGSKRALGLKKRQDAEAVHTPKGQVIALMNGRKNLHMFSVPVFSLISKNMADVRRFKRLMISAPYALGP